MKIEFLYPDFYLYGEEAVPEFLKKTIPEAEIIFDNIGEEPRFVSEKPDFIYMGGMSEKNRDRSIDALMPYKDKLNELISSGVHGLFTSTSLDCLGTKITGDNYEKKALGLFPFHSVEKLMKRYHGLFVGKYDSITIIGFKSQFTEGFADTSDFPYFIKTDRGIGLNKGADFEGVRRNNFFATYSLGPFIIQNPSFTKKILSEANGKEVVIPIEKLAFENYERRIKEFYDPKKDL